MLIAWGTLDDVSEIQSLTIVFIVLLLDLGLGRWFRCRRCGTRRCRGGSWPRRGSDVRGRRTTFHATLHAGRGARYVIQHLVADQCGQRVNAHARTSFRVLCACDRIQQTCSSGTVKRV